MTKPLAIAALLAACAPPPGATAVARSLSAPAGCRDPALSGASPGDGLSDRAPIQAALDDAAAAGGGTVCLGPGRWTVDRAPDGSYNNHAALSTHGRNVSLVGAGPETVLELAGDQGGNAVIVFSVDPGAEHVRVADLTVDTTDSTNTHEQTHAFGTSGACSGDTCRPIRDVEFDDVGCVHPRNTPSRKGDCFRLLGNQAPDPTATPPRPGTEVYGVRIVGVHVADAARSAVVLQRGLNGVVIADSTLHCEACDQLIDGEATGGGWDRGVVVAGNALSSGPSVQGGFAIACTSCDGAAITGNVMDRGIALYRTRRAVVSGNAVSLVARDGRAVVEAHNACDGLALTGNALSRSGVAGPVVDLGPHGGVLCGGVSVHGNTITQGTAAPAISMASVSRAAVVGNAITHTAPAPGHGSVYARAVIAGAPVSALAISGNVVHGPVTFAVRLSAHPGQFGAGVSISGNAADGPQRGFSLEDQNFTAPIAASGNAWPASLPGYAVVHAGAP